MTIKRIVTFIVVRPTVAQFQARRDDLHLTKHIRRVRNRAVGMKKSIGKMLLPLAACLLIGEAFGSTAEPVRLFVKEVPLKVLGKDLSVIAIEQADGTQGYSPEKADGFHVEVVN